MMGARHWSFEERETLRSLRKTNATAIDCAAHLPGRSAYAIRCYAKKIGIPFDNGVYSPEEDEIVRQIWRSEETIKIGLRRLPGRTYSAIKERARFLKLGPKTRSPRGIQGWIRQAIIQALTDNPALTAKELSERVGAVEKSVTTVLNHRHGKDFYISAWGKVGASNYARRWSLGTKRDAVKPARLTTKEVSARKYAARGIRVGRINPFAILTASPPVLRGQTGRIVRNLHDEDSEIDREVA
jgi:hypothetical protein